MMMRIMVVAAIGVLAVSRSFGDDDLPSGLEIATRVNERDEGVQVSRRLRMEMTDKRGKTRVRDTFGYRKYFGEEKRTIIFYLSPANIKDTAFLTFDYPDPKDDDDQWLYLPAARKVRRISSSDRGDYFLGTDFTYEDIKKESKYSLEDYTFERVGRETVDGRDCYVIEATPIDKKTARELGYGKVKAWIDFSIWMPVKSEFWDVRMNPLKTIRLEDIQEIDGIQTAMTIEAKNHKTGHTTRFTFDEVDYEAEVDDEIFTKRILERGVKNR